MNLFVGIFSMFFLSTSIVDWAKDNRAELICLAKPAPLAEIEKLAASLTDEGRAVIVAPLADSYEQQRLTALGYQAAPTLQEYRHIFRENNLTLLHVEVEHDLARFTGIDEVLQWIQEEIAPCIEITESELESFVDSYFQSLETERWIHKGNGLGFPYKRLIVLVEKKFQ